MSLAPITKIMGLTFDRCKCGHVVWAHYTKTTGICMHCNCDGIRDPNTGNKVVVPNP